MSRRRKIAHVRTLHAGSGAALSSPSTSVRVDIYRMVETSESITGESWIDGAKECCYLEPSRYTPFHPGHPCIPAGSYRVVLTYSPHLGYVCPEVLNVLGRTAIRWHVGNFPKDVLGCCVVGTAVGSNQVENSKTAFVALMAKLEGREIVVFYQDPQQSGDGHAEGSSVPSFSSHLSSE